MIHYFWIICEDGQEGEHSLELSDVTCEKCKEQMSAFEGDVLLSEAKHRLEKREDNASR